MNNNTKRDTATAHDEAASLRAKERADHKAWLRDNAASITVPERPADTGDLPDTIRCEQRNAIGVRCNRVNDHVGFTEHRYEMPGDRALSDLIAEERASTVAECVTKLRALGHEMAAVHISEQVPIEGRGDLQTMLHDAKVKGAAEEREACAAIAENHAVRSQWDLDHFQEDIASAIRARGQR